MSPNTATMAVAHTRRPDRRKEGMMTLTTLIRGTHDIPSGVSECQSNEVCRERLSVDLVSCTVAVVVHPSLLVAGLDTNTHFSNVEPIIPALWSLELTGCQQRNCMSVSRACTQLQIDSDPTWIQTSDRPDRSRR